MSYRFSDGDNGIGFDVNQVVGSPLNLKYAFRTKKVLNIVLICLILVQPIC